MSCFRTAVMACLIATHVQAQEPGRELPSVAQSGLDALVEDGFREAVDIWAEQWSGPDLEARRQIEDSFRRLFEAHGPARAYDVVGVSSIGRRVLNVCVVVVHDRLPVYLRLLVYDAPDGWRVTSIVFNLVVDDSIAGAGCLRPIVTWGVEAEPWSR